MGARNGIIVGSTLLAICCLAFGRTSAMERGQPGAFASSSVEALPSFLDDERLPALQEAWRAHEPSSAALLPRDNDRPSQFAPAATIPDDPMAAARAAMKRAKQSGQDDQSVRRRAEELSRRFGAGAGTNASEAKTAASPDPQTTSAQSPSEPQAAAEVKTTTTPVGAVQSAPASKAAPVAEAPAVAVPATPVIPVMPAPKARMLTASVGATGSVTPPKTKLSAAYESAFVEEKLRLAAPPPPQRTPPLPLRAPKYAAEPKHPTQTVMRTVVRHQAPVARSYAAPRRGEQGDPLAALRGTVLTTQLRSFGWNSQPK